MKRDDKSSGICARWQSCRVSINFGLSLPHAANGRFKASIALCRVPGIGRERRFEASRSADVIDPPEIMKSLQRFPGCLDAQFLLDNLV
jgi:hypothetical protein